MRKFSYWYCDTHVCGSFNFNSLNRHQMPWCDIVKSIRILSKPRTLGGFNGDVSRKYYPDWDKYCVELQHKKQRTQIWERQVKANDENVDFNRKRFKKFMEDLDD